MWRAAPNESPSIENQRILQKSGYSEVMKLIIQQGAIAATKSDLIAFVHNHHGIAVGFSADLFHIVQIDDEGAMDPQESARIQSFLQPSHGFS